MIDIQLKAGQETFTKAQILPLAQRPPLQMIFKEIMEKHKNKLGINKYTVGSIVSDEISIFLYSYLQMLQFKTLHSLEC